MAKYYRITLMYPIWASHYVSDRTGQQAVERFTYCYDGIEALTKFMRGQIPRCVVYHRGGIPMSMLFNVRYTGSNPSLIGRTGLARKHKWPANLLVQLDYREDSSPDELDPMCYGWHMVSRYNWERIRD